MMPFNARPEGEIVAWLRQAIHGTRSRAGLTAPAETRFRSFTNGFHKVRLALHLTKWKSLRIAYVSCPSCEMKRPFVKLGNSPILVRCTRCRSTTIALSLVSVLKEIAPDLREKSVYELSSRGSLYAFLERKAGHLTGSEYFEHVAPGQTRGGVLCQNVECLTFEDESFDVCTSTEVFEHVADDARGFSEIYRILKPGGVFVFTVPMSGKAVTTERARWLPNGEIEYILPPHFHGDHLRGWGKVLVYRDYGQDIVSRLKACGFEAEIRYPSASLPWGYAVPVLVGYKHCASP